MAANKRAAIRHIRDGIKSRYVRGSECEACGSTHELEFHHFTTVSLLLEKYCKDNGIVTDTDEQVLAMRDGFYAAHEFELLHDTVTLCREHHVLLHKIYGSKPPIATAQKQRDWVKRFRDRLSGTDSHQIIDSSDPFAKFLTQECDSFFEKFLRG